MMMQYIRTEQQRKKWSLHQYNVVPPEMTVQAQYVLLTDTAINTMGGSVVSLYMG